MYNLILTGSRPTVTVALHGLVTILDKFQLVLIITYIGKLSACRSNVHCSKMQKMLVKAIFEFILEHSPQMS